MMMMMMMMMIMMMMTTITKPINMIMKNKLYSQDNDKDDNERTTKANTK